MSRLSEHRGALACVAGLALWGCDIYDIEPALAALDASASASLELADRCSVDGVPLMESHSESHLVTLDGLVDDERTLTGCDGMGLDGPDGFVRLAAAAEQRWSILVEPLEAETDVVLYVLPTCDPQSCTDLLDRCGAGIPESFVFQAPSEGEYLLGVDTRTGAGALEVTLLSTRCGDRRRELGEGCDDGNLVEGDGCDRECRLEIAPDRPREIEPNNWPTEANVVPIDAAVGERTITGRLGGACDVDYYVVRLAQAASVSAVLLDGASLACPASTPPVTMELLNPDGTTRRGEGATGGEGGACPSIEGAAFAADLGAGAYFLRIGAGRDLPTLDYNLRIQIDTGS